MSAADELFISGATGVYDASINGVYDRTSETSDGHALYGKRGDKSMCMEHFRGNWQVKHVSNKGTAICYAYVLGGCGAEACTSRQWMVTFDSKAHAEAPLVKMAAGAGAEAQRQAAAAAAALADDNARAVPVFISGATGIHAAEINGVFDPTQEKSLDDRVLYAKRGDESVCMEHFAGKWMVKPVSLKGKVNCHAYVWAGCGAEACTSRQWMVTFDNITFAETPLVKIVAEAETPEGKAKAAAEAKVAAEAKAAAEDKHHGR